MEDKILDACRVLWGPDITVDRNFLSCYLEPYSLKRAYRRMALLTHPDQAVTLGEKVQKKNTRLFIKVKSAYDELIDFITKKDNGIEPSVTEIKVHKQTARKYRKNYRQSGMPPGQRFHKGSVPHWDLRFSEFLYYRGMISWKIFIRSIVWQRRQRPLFGMIAVNWKLITDQEVKNMLNQRKFAEKVGETAVRLNLLDQIEINSILIYQKHIQKPIGQFFVEQGYLTPERIHYLLKELADHNTPLRGY